MLPRVPWPTSRRRRAVLVLLGVAAVFRVLLPYVLRPILVAQASQALHARVEIGDVDCSLLRGGVALERVTVRPPEGAPAPPAEEPAWIAWKRVAVELRWLPLFRKAIRLRTIEIDSLHVALDRLENGGFNLTTLGKPPAAEGEVPPPSAAPSPWSFGVDRLVLRQGGVRFRDRTLPDLEPVEVTLADVQVARVGLAPGVYGEPARLALAVQVDRGRLRLDARIGLREDGVAVDATLSARRLPLHRVRLYVPGVGWSDLRGELGAGLRYRRDPGVRDALDGVVVLRDVTVQVPDLEGPALAWRRFAVHLSPVDLAGRRVAVAAMTLDGAALVVRPRGGAALPVASRPAAVASVPPESPAVAPATAATAPPWRWSIASVSMPDLRVSAVAPDAAADFRVALTAHDLTGDGDTPAPVTLAVGVEDGTLSVDGALRIAQPGFAGHVKLDALPLPQLVALAGVLPAGVLQAGRLAVDLTVEAGSQAQPPGDVRVAGAITLADLWLAGTDAREFAIGAQTLAAKLDEVRIPGALAAKRAGEFPGPIGIALADLELAKPYMQLTRIPEGLVLPPLAPPLAEAASPPDAPPSPPAAAPPAVTLALARFHLGEGRVYVTDRTVKPFYAGAIDPLDVEVRGLRWPALAIASVRVGAVSPKQGRVDVYGALSPERGWVDVSTKALALPPFNPYVTAFSPYSIARGTLTLSTKAAVVGARTDVGSAIVLHDLDVASRGGESLFQEQFGIPLSMALALLRDLSGDISLEVPITIDEEGTRVGLGTVIAGALRGALVGAIASPLKLVGAVFQGGEGRVAPPAPIGFLVGRDQLAPGADDQVAQLAALLASRPGLAVTLSAAPTPQDVRWLAEQALREEFAAPQGVVGALRNLPERGARNRIGTALEARATGEVGALDPADAEQLEHWLGERPAVGADRLVTLATARIARVAGEFAQRHGLAAGRVVRGEAAGVPVEGVPAVQVTLGAAR